MITCYLTYRIDPYKTERAVPGAQRTGPGVPGGVRHGAALPVHPQLRAHVPQATGRVTLRRSPSSGYGVSKAALNALTSTFAAELDGTPVLVNAASVVWAATLPGDGPSGGLFRDGRPLAG